MLRVTSVHSEQYWLAVALGPFLVFILLFVKVGLAVFHVLQFSELIEEREHEDIVTVLLGRYPVSLRNHLRDAPVFHVGDCGSSHDRARVAAQVLIAFPSVEILVDIISEREVEVSG